MAVTTLRVFQLHLSVLLPCEWWGRRSSQPLQHRGCADQATAWGLSPKYKPAASDETKSRMPHGRTLLNAVIPAVYQLPTILKIHNLSRIQISDMMRGVINLRGGQPNIWHVFCYQMLYLWYHSTQTNSVGMKTDNIPNERI